MLRLQLVPKSMGIERISRSLLRLLCLLHMLSLLGSEELLVGCGLLMIRDVVGGQPDGISMTAALLELRVTMGLGRFLSMIFGAASHLSEYHLQEGKS